MSLKQLIQQAFGITPPGPAPFTDGSVVLGSMEQAALLKAPPPGQLVISRPKASKGDFMANNQAQLCLKSDSTRNSIVVQNKTGMNLLLSDVPFTPGSAQDGLFIPAGYTTPFELRGWTSELWVCCYWADSTIPFPNGFFFSVYET